MGFRPDVAANDLTDVLKTSDDRTVNVERTHDIPAGTILDYGGARLPPGFLWCDGAAVSRATYRGLYNAIGTAFGPGDGTTTFNVPVAGDGVWRNIPAFFNNWAGFALPTNTPMYMIDRFGIVHMRGLVANSISFAVGSAILNITGAPKLAGADDYWSQAAFDNSTSTLGTAMLSMVGSGVTLSLSALQTISWASNAFVSLAGIHYQTVALPAGVPSGKIIRV